jgi:hypothetical protein
MKRVAEDQLDQVLCAARAFCSLIRQESLTVRNPEEDRPMRASDGESI